MFVLFFVPLLADGVFGVTDEVKSVSVMEGNSVTLYTDLTEIQKAHLILWTFGSDSTRIVQINRMANKISLYDNVLDGRFRGRLKVDHQNGSLTITKITNEHAGIYRFLQIIDGTEVLPKKFSIVVSAPMPIPDIFRDCSSSSSQQICSLVCSVVNVNDVTLSWYKGNSLLSSISASDLSISLSLPLEVEYQDKNIYSCVINNPISNHTQHLDISELCHTCSAPGLSTGHIALVCICALAVAAVLCGIYYYCQRKTCKCPDKRDVPDEKELERLNAPGNNGDIHQPTDANGETSNDDRCSKNGAVPLLAAEVDAGGNMSVQEGDLETSVLLKEDKITSKPVIEGQCVTLHTDLSKIREFDMIWWKFADSKECSCAKFVLIATLNKTNNEVCLYNETIQQFKDSLKLNHDTGSLTITSVTPEHYGYYKLHITSKEEMVVHTFSVVAHNLMKREQTPNLSQRRQTYPSLKQMTLQ
ncbi:hepatocyte cell adhesion molecule isoform X3 [Labeo rohita]|uniref:hepatocyte cell adhesion molecule isoform X3 n=1 Tax=Labeo rohita TaxID=84645 RepID=UPI0021E22C6E|nr:hepatocyte cell adhesion molecule isoform X3 [Labeo rohita]